MIRLKTKLSTLPALIAGLIVAMPVGARVDGAMLTFSPGKGLAPKLQVTRGTIGAGQQVTTGTSEVREILFPDGTSVTLAPGSDVAVEAVDASDNGGGQLVLRLNKGLLRVAGGGLNERTPIIVKTAAGEVRLDAASAVVEVNAEGKTRASLLAGKRVELQNGGQTQSVEKPGFELVSLTGQQPPAGPARQPEGGAATDAFGLGTAQLSGLTKDEEDQLGRVGLSELAAAGAATLTLATEQQPSGTLSLSPGAGSPGPGVAPTPTPGFTEIGVTNGASGSDGFTVGGGQLNPDNLSQAQPSETNGDKRSLAQDKGNAVANNGTLNEPIRVSAATTNRLFNSDSVDPYSQAIDGTTPTTVRDKRSQAPLEYVFRVESGLDSGVPGIQLSTVGLTEPQTENPDTHVLLGNLLFSTSAPFILTGPKIGSELLPIPWPAAGAVTQVNIAEPNYATSQHGFTGSGSIFTVASHWEILQSGFSIVSRRDVHGVDRKTVERAPDNFLLVEVRPARLSLASPEGAELDPGRSERFIFATGNVDAGRFTIDGNGNPVSRNPAFTNTFAVDRFFVSAGLDGFEQREQGRTVASNIRGFLRQPTAFGQTLTDSGLFVINTGSPSSSAQNGVLHADFGMQGAGSNQQSTISITLGQVKYDFAVCDNNCTRSASEFGQQVIPESATATASGRTIGSSRGAVRPGQFGTVAINSPLMSTSFGGGNPQLKRDGYAGYFVLENYTPAADQSAEASLAGGLEHALGSSPATDDVRYAILRLATATGQETPDTRTNAVLTGWAGGLAEKENGPVASLTINPIGTGTTPNNVVIQTDAANNRVQADLLLTGHAPMTLGGPDHPSAMIDDNRFAAANDSVAMVNANVLRDASGNLPASLNLPNGQPIPHYQYLQWGFLLGDTAGKAGVDLEHLHMGIWIAGRAADPNQMPTTGSATYSGHAIGNVASGGALYTAVGSYDNTWNFAQRAGTVNMNFDGGQYSGTTQLTNGANFQGTMSAVNRAGGVVGNFVQAPGGSPAGGPPPAVAGRFVIQETAGNAYRASGTFGAERSH